MTQDPVRIGFIGAGQHARSMLYPSLHFVPEVRLAAIATRTVESAARAEMRFDTAGGTLWRNSTSVAYNRLNTLYASGYAAEIEDFAACIRGGRTPLSSLGDAAGTDALRRAVEESVRGRG